MQACVCTQPLGPPFLHSDDLRTRFLQPRTPLTAVDVVLGPEAEESLSWLRMVAACTTSLYTRGSMEHAASVCACHAVLPCW